MTTSLGSPEGRELSNRDLVRIGSDIRSGRRCRAPTTVESSIEIGSSTATSALPGLPLRRSGPCHGTFRRVFSRWSQRETTT